jgi:hypothetical protein
VLALLESRYIEVPSDTIYQADSLGCLIFGLLRSDKNARFG